MGFKFPAPHPGAAVPTPRKSATQVINMTSKPSLHALASSWILPSRQAGMGSLACSHCQPTLVQASAPLHIS